MAHFGVDRHFCIELTPHHPSPLKGIIDCIPHGERQTLPTPLRVWDRARVGRRERLPSCILRSQLHHSVQLLRCGHGGRCDKWCAAAAMYLRQVHSPYCDRNLKFCNKIRHFFDRFLCTPHGRHVALAACCSFQIPRQTRTSD